jgi:cellulose synthase (UDP-forming)
MLTRITIIITLAATSLFLWDSTDILAQRLHAGDVPGSVEQGVFLVLIGLILYGNFVYQFCRLGYFKRLSTHQPASPAELDAFAHDGTPPPIVFLIPSYKEDPRIIWQALVSTALQEYPNRRVVLLIDDPPEPSSPEDLALLTAATRLPLLLQEQLSRESASYNKAASAYLRRRQQGPIDVVAERCALARLYRQAALWFQDQAVGYQALNHTDRLFVEKVLLERSHRHLARAKCLEDPRAAMSEQDISREYQRLASLFQVSITSFERKRYVNFSHEPNKAMNLNSYIEALGKDWREWPAMTVYIWNQLQRWAPRFTSQKQPT